MNTVQKITLKQNKSVNQVATKGHRTRFGYVVKEYKVTDR